MFLKNKYFWFGVGISLLLMIYFLGNGELQFHRLLFYIQQQQNQLQRTMSKTLSALRHGNDLAAWWGVVSLGLMYGILHAIGPGHGKAVVSTFLLTQPSNYKSAVGLAVGGALLQGISAILWVAVTLGLMQWLIREAVGQVIWAERLSYCFIIAVGVYILWRNIKGQKQKKDHQQSCSCGHHHHHLPHKHYRPTSVKSSHSHLLAMLAIGMRPCSGSILALAAAASWHLWGVGIAMTLAISCGTAITVLTLALLTVYGREKIALNLSAESGIWQRGFHALILVGAAILIFLGTLLLIASFTQPTTGLFNA